MKGSAADAVGKTARRMADQARSSTGPVAGYVDRHRVPIAIACGGLAAFLIRRQAREAGRAADRYRRRAQDTAGEYAARATRRARDFGQTARAAAAESRTRLVARSHGAGESFGRWVAERPLTAGLAAFAVGAAAGLALPTTAAEDRTLGVARDRLIEQAGRAVEAAAEPPAI